jgi:hypothetical protein
VLPFRRRRLAAAAAVPVIRRRRRVRRIVTLGAATAGVLAWRERQLARNAERYWPPPSA